VENLCDESSSKRLSLKFIVDLDAGASSKRLLLKLIDDLISGVSSKRFFFGIFCLGDGHPLQIYFPLLRLV
jgi:hypothetical protein